MDGFCFRGRPDDNSQPGWRSFGASPPAAAVSLAGERTVIDIATDGAIDAVFVGARSSFSDALAANSFERLHDPP